MTPDSTAPRKRDLVAKATGWVRQHPLGAGIVILSISLIGLASVVEAWRSIWPARGSLEVVGMTAIDDPDSVSAFRREWLGDSLPEADIPIEVDRLARFPDSLPVVINPAGSIATDDRLMIRLPPAPSPESARAWRESARASFLNWPGPRGTGRFPIIDLKFRNTSSSPVFLTHLTFVARRRAFHDYSVACGVTTPSWEYNILLDPTKQHQTISLSVSQAIEPNGVDRFLVVVGHEPEGDAEYDLTLTAIYNRDLQLRLGTVRIEVGTTGCSPLHPLEQVRVVRR